MKFKYIASCFLLAAATWSCGGSSHNDDACGAKADTITANATLLKIIDRGDYTEVQIADPWRKEGAMLARLALVPRDSGDSAPEPEGCTVVRVPIERSVIFSSVHTAPVFEIGAGEAVTAVADGQYFATDDTVSALLSSGHIADIGSSSSPSIEQILALEAEAVLMSPMQNSDNGAMTRSGIAVIPMADYMERTPLARAEWIKLLGKLYGCESRADSVYADVCDTYNSLCSLIAGKNKPVVLTETLTSGVWYVPGGNSYMAAMLADAGASYPWDDNDSEGSLSLDASAVLDKAADADYWLLRCFGHTPSFEELATGNPAASHIKAYREGNVFVCDTSRKNIFNDIAFHPERVLRDFIAIFHPKALGDAAPQYYEKL